MKRKIIEIDQEKCTGCGQCITGCPEGAIQLIDKKARLIGDLFCDGLGACIGECPVGAIKIEEREAQPYSEEKVMENIVKQGNNVIRAHIEHLQEHQQCEYMEQALAVLKKKGIPNPLEQQEEPVGGQTHAHMHDGCPGARSRDFAKKKESTAGDTGGTRPSQLTHWPVQLHLMSPMAPHYRGKDVLLAADCVAYTLGEFHRDYLKGKALAIACPKLDEGQESYVEKIRALIDDARINTLTVMIMEVPCCTGLLHLAQEALSKASRKAPVKCVVVGLEGDVLSEQWV